MIQSPVSSLLSPLSCFLSPLSSLLSPLSCLPSVVFVISRSDLGATATNLSLCPYVLGVFDSYWDEEFLNRVRKHFRDLQTTFSM